MVLINKYKQTFSDSTTLGSDTTSSSSCNEDFTPNVSCATTKKKSVSLAPSKMYVYHVDTLTFEERSHLYSTPKDLRRYKQGAKELIAKYHLYGSNLSSIDANKYCSRGLEKYCEESPLTKTKGHYVNCILQLQDEFQNIIKGGRGLNPERREKLICAIEKLDTEATTKALKRASEDRSAANQIYREDIKRRRHSREDYSSKS